MTIECIYKLIKNRRTSASELEELYNEHSPLPLNVLMKMVLHTNATSELIKKIFNDEGRFPEVANVVARRTDLMDSTTIQLVSYAIQKNPYNWSYEDHLTIFKSFERNFLLGENICDSEWWPNSSFEKICSNIQPANISARRIHEVVHFEDGDWFEPDEVFENYDDPDELRQHFIDEEGSEEYFDYDSTDTIERFACN